MCCTISMSLHSSLLQLLVLLLPTLLKLLLLLQLQMLFRPFPLDLLRSTIVEIQGVRVGIVGYITTTTAVISKPGPDILFFPVVQAVRKEARRLRQGKIIQYHSNDLLLLPRSFFRYNISDPVDIVIGLGHNGYDNDVAMAK